MASALKPTTAKVWKLAMLLANNTMAEQYHEIVQNREAARSKLDARHHHILSTIAFAINESYSSVEDRLLSYVKGFQRFFEGKERALVVFYEPETTKNGEGKLTLFGPEQMDGCVVLFFNRRVSDEITSETFQPDNFSFGMFDFREQSVLDVARDTISKLALPMYRNLEESHWGKAEPDKVNKYLKGLETFAFNIDEAKQTIDEQIVLDLPDPTLHMERINQMKPIAGDRKLVSQLELLVESWIRSIEEVLAHWGQVRTEEEALNPQIELQQCKRRFVIFGGLLDQMKLDEVKHTLIVLKIAKSPTLPKWQSVDGRLTDAANEAKDLYRYMYALNEMCEAVQNVRPKEMADAIPRLIRRVTLLARISQYFRRSEHLTALFMKVTNLVIRSLKMDLFRENKIIWEVGKPAIETSIEDGELLLSRYKEVFQKTREEFKRDYSSVGFDLDVSETYVFGKLEALVNRLKNLDEIIEELESLRSVQSIKEEGSLWVHSSFDELVTYLSHHWKHVLEMKKADFDNLVRDVTDHFDEVYRELDTFAVKWLDRPRWSKEKLDFMERFDKINPDKFRHDLKYAAIFHKYTQELDQVYQYYTQNREEPEIERGVPPTSGKILWIRHLYDKIEAPILILQDKIDLAATDHGKATVKKYNHIAQVFVEGEVMLKESYAQVVDDAHFSLNSGLLDREKETNELKVNLHIRYQEAIGDAKQMIKSGIEIPDTAKDLLQLEPKIRSMNARLADILLRFRTMIRRVHPLLKAISEPMKKKVETSLTPGVRYLSWKAINIDVFLLNAEKHLDELERVWKRMSDILDQADKHQVEISRTVLSFVPTEPMAADAYKEAARLSVQQGIEFIRAKHNQTECCLREMIEVVKQYFSDEDPNALDEEMRCASTKSKENRCNTCLPCAMFELVNLYTQKNMESLLHCTQISLEHLRRQMFPSTEPMTRFILIKATQNDENIVLKPLLEDARKALISSGQVILKPFSNLSSWTFLHHQHLLPIESSISLSTVTSRPESKFLSNNRSLVRLVLTLKEAMPKWEAEINSNLDMYRKYSYLFSLDCPTKRDVAGLPLWQFEEKIKSYFELTVQLRAAPAAFEVGPFSIESDLLKESLIAEARNLMVFYGRNLCDHLGNEVDSVTSFTIAMERRLSNNMGDLEDMRYMAEAVAQVRAREAGTSLMLGPVEEALNLLSRFGIYIRQDQSEKVDTLAYEWKKLQNLSNEVSDQLQEKEPEFRHQLIRNGDLLTEEIDRFMRDYDNTGLACPEMGVFEGSYAVSDISLRLKELIRKHEQYSKGEQLLGIPLTQRPELYDTMQHVNDVEQFYQLFSELNKRIEEYSEIAWIELDIDKMAVCFKNIDMRVQNVSTFAHQWPIYAELCSETNSIQNLCVLLQRMSSSHLRERHWQEVSDLVGQLLDATSENLTLDTIFQVKEKFLLHRDDIMDICMSASMEKDVESELNSIRDRWAGREFTFHQVRGKGAIVGESSDIINDIEISLVQLDVLLGNRYNRPFLEDIQTWYQRLSLSAEIIENWLSVQKLWISLKSVFSGADVNKQLPQEAKRFNSIDNSWSKLMMHAQETADVMTCCAYDDTMEKLLPHLLDQLEHCRRSLTAFLESKRCNFPRFFFISDPALLEILGHNGDLAAVKKYLNECIGGATELIFQDPGCERLIAVVSSANERLDLTKPVRSKYYGEAEQAMTTLLQEIRETVHTLLRDGARIVVDKSFQLKEHLGVQARQVLEYCLRFMWTMSIEDALHHSRKDKKSLNEASDQCAAVLRAMYQMRRRPGLAVKARQLEIFIPLQIYLKDCVEELTKKQVKTISDFEWQKLLRHYYNVENEQFSVSITDHSFQYQCEFQDEIEYIFISPTSERCQVTIAQAIGNHQGLLMFGNEANQYDMLRSLASCLGTFLFFASVRSGMTPTATFQFIRGAVQSGCWTCLSQITKLDTSTLSLVATMLQEVTSYAHSRKPECIITSGETIQIMPSYGIFFALESTEDIGGLPQNLRASLRPFWMANIDIKIYLEIHLLTMGYEGAHRVATKLSFVLTAISDLYETNGRNFIPLTIKLILRAIKSIRQTNSLGRNEEQPCAQAAMEILSTFLRKDEKQVLESLIRRAFTAPSMIGTQESLLESQYTEDEIEEIHKSAATRSVLGLAPKACHLLQALDTSKAVLVVGSAGSGKTETISLLKKALFDMGRSWKNISIYPGAQNVSELIGDEDSEGLLPSLWKKALNYKKDEEVCFIFDGQVDNIWADTLGTALLSGFLMLHTGERLQMPKTFRFIFETDTLESGSPSLIGNCAILWNEHENASILELLLKWVDDCQLGVDRWLIEYLLEMFSQFFNFVVQEWNMKPNETGIPKHIMLKTSFDILRSLLVCDNMGRRDEQLLQKFAFLSILWSIQWLFTGKDRVEKLHAFSVENHYIPETIEADHLYRIFIDSNGSWETINDCVLAGDGYVNTPRILNIQNMVKLTKSINKPILLIGGHGVGKTSVIEHALSSEVKNEMFRKLTLSRSVDCSRLQQSITHLYAKSVGTTLGPPSGSTMSIFIDDFHLPARNTPEHGYNQEFLRELIEINGFYSNKKLGQLVRLADTRILLAMTQAKHWDNHAIGERTRRHYFTLRYDLPNDEEMRSIFGSKASAHFNSENGFNDDLCELIEPLVKSSTRVFNSVRSTFKQMLGKPLHSFSMRVIARLWQSMQTWSAADFEEDTDTLLSIWRHECCRLFADRLSLHDERRHFIRILDQTLLEVFQRDCSKFKIFLLPNFDAESDKGPLRICKNIGAAKLEIAEQLENKSNIENTVLFQAAVVNILRVARALCLDQSCLLTGSAQCGKKTIAQLAALCCGYHFITPSKFFTRQGFINDLKRACNICANGGAVLFYVPLYGMPDEIVEILSIFLKDFQMIGQLLTREETDMLLQPLKSTDSPWQLILRKNLRFALSYPSEVTGGGDQLHTWINHYPGLLSAVSIIWFENWSGDTLTSIGKNFINIEATVSDTKVHQGVLRCLIRVQEAANQLYSWMSQEKGFPISHVTGLFISFVKLFNNMVAEKHEFISSRRQKILTVLDKHQGAIEMAGQLTGNLADEESCVAQASKEVDEILAELVEARKYVDEAQQVYSQIFEKVKEAFRSVSVDRLVAEERLSEVQPAFEESKSALSTIKPKHIATVRKLAKPPHLIMRIMDVVLLLFRKKLDPVKSDMKYKCPKPSWSEATKFMVGNLLNLLTTFPAETINEEMLELMAPYIEMSDYNLETARKVCGDVAGLLAWTRAMNMFYSINERVKPLKEHVDQLIKMAGQFSSEEFDLDKLMANVTEHEKMESRGRMDSQENMRQYQAKLWELVGRLNRSREELNKRQAYMDDIQNKYEAAVKRKHQHSENVVGCKRRIATSGSLIEGLDAELFVWRRETPALNEALRVLVGDCILAAAFLTYAGPLDSQVRNQALTEWKKILRNQDVPFNEDLKLWSYLEERLTVSFWKLHGLADAQHSVESAVITMKCKTLPIVIDPHSIAIRWFNTQFEGNIRVFNVEDERERFETAFAHALSKKNVVIVQLPLLCNTDQQVNKVKSILNKLKHDGHSVYIRYPGSTPVFSPDLLYSATVVNFAADSNMLANLFLTDALKIEKKELELDVGQLMDEMHMWEKCLDEQQRGLLDRIASITGSILDDVNLVDFLRTTKIVQREAKEKMENITGALERLSSVKEDYRPAAKRASYIYLTANDMSLISSQYQFSLDEILGAFNDTLLKCAKNPITSRRVTNILETVTFDLINYVCMGLQNIHRHVFLLLVAIHVKRTNDSVFDSQVDVLVNVGSEQESQGLPQKRFAWIPDEAWKNLCSMRRLPQFSSIFNQIAEYEKEWKSWFESSTPELNPIPNQFDNMDVMLRLLIIRCFTPNRFLHMINIFSDEMFSLHVLKEDMVYVVEECIETSVPPRPIVCFLAPGDDPGPRIRQLAGLQKKEVISVSIGADNDGQIIRLAKKAIREDGQFLVYNCSLDQTDTLLNLLQLIQHEASGQVHFRCWLMYNKWDVPPSPLLIASTKFFYLDNDSLKQNMITIYRNISQDYLEACSLKTWPSVLYAVSFLFSAVQALQKRQAITTTNEYIFSLVDYAAIVRILQNTLDEMDFRKGVSWQALQYVITQIGFSGELPSDCVQRLLVDCSKFWMYEGILESRSTLYDGYPMVHSTKIKDFHAAVEAFPLPFRDLFNPNWYSIFKSSQVLQCLPMTRITKHKKIDENKPFVAVRAAVETLQNELPSLERIRQMTEHGPAGIPSEAFVFQEINQFSREMSKVHHEIQMAFELADGGMTRAGHEHVECFECLSVGEVPAHWAGARNHQSVQKWMDHVNRRFKQLNAWLNAKKPACHWLPTFSNPSAFVRMMSSSESKTNQKLTATVLKITNTNDIPSHSIQEGFYVDGLFLKGAMYEARSGAIVVDSDARGGSAINPLPIVFISGKTEEAVAENMIEVPVYKSEQEPDILFILLVKTKRPVVFWRLRGVAAYALG